jgi:hypothetical protein
MYLTSGGRNLSNTKININNKKMLSLKAKSIPIIGSPDNQRPDKWSFVVCTKQVSRPAQQFMHIQPTVKRL